MLSSLTVEFRVYIAGPYVIQRNKILVYVTPVRSKLLENCFMIGRLRGKSLAITRRF